MSILSNTWFIGFSASVVSGLLVTWIAGKIESRRSHKEVRQRVDGANREVLNSIRSLVADKQMPTNDTIESMLSSAARKSGLKKPDLLTPEELAAEIVSQVISDPFLSSKHKVEYSEFVESMMATAIAQQLKSAGKVDERELPEKGRRDISLILGAATFVSVLLVIPITTLGNGTIMLNKENIRNLFLIIAVAIVIPTVCLWVVDFYRDLQELRTVRLEIGRSNSGRRLLQKNVPGKASDAASRYHKETGRGKD